MQTPSPPSAGLTEKLFEELLTELRTERSNMREQHHELVKERKAERRWKTIFQFALIGIPLLGTIAYVIFFTSAMGFQWGPFGSVVGVVRIDGEISAQSVASAKRVIPILEKAFASLARSAQSSRLGICTRQLNALMSRSTCMPRVS